VEPAAKYKFYKPSEAGKVTKDVTEPGLMVVQRGIKEGLEEIPVRTIQGPGKGTTRVEMGLSKEADKAIKELMYEATGTSKPAARLIRHGRIIEQPMDIPVEVRPVSVSVREADVRLFYHDLKQPTAAEKHIKPFKRASQDKAQKHTKDFLRDIDIGAKAEEPIVASAGGSKTGQILVQLEKQRPIQIQAPAEMKTDLTGMSVKTEQFFDYRTRMQIGRRKTWMDILAESEEAIPYAYETVYASKPSHIGPPVAAPLSQRTILGGMQQGWQATRLNIADVGLKQQSVAASLKQRQSSLLNLRTDIGVKQAQPQAMRQVMSELQVPRTTQLQTPLSVVETTGIETPVVEPMPAPSRVTPPPPPPGRTWPPLVIGFPDLGASSKYGFGKKKDWRFSWWINPIGKLRLV